MTETVNKAKEKNVNVGTGRLLLIMCWVVYASAYVARGNLSIARSVMIDQGIFDAGVAGIVGAVYFGVYAAGQVLNGILADRKSPFVLVTIGVMIVIVANFGMGFHMPPYYYIICWGINGIGQSMLWSPVYFIVSTMLPERQKYFGVIAIGLCAPVGKIVSSLLSGAVIGDTKWSNAFFAASLVMMGASILWIAGYLSVRKGVAAHAEHLKREDKIDKRDRKEKKGKEKISLAPLVAGGFLLMIPSLIVYGLLYNGVVELVPSILISNYGMTPFGAAVLNVVIPILGTVGVLMCGFVYKHVTKRDEMKGAALSMALCLIPLALMIVLTLSEGGIMFGKKIDALIFAVSYGVIYLLQCTVGTFFMNYIPLKFASFNLAATASGFANAVCYFGSAFSVYGMSYAVEYLPLSTIMIFLGGTALLSSLLFIPTCIKWSRFKRENESGK